MKFDDIDMCYLAGMFDGDGSFSLIKRIERDHRSPLYFPLIQLGASGDDLLSLLKMRFGGYINLKESHLSNEGFLRKNFFRFKLEKAAQCKPFLEMIIPYLKLKQQRAQILLDYINDHPFIRGSRKISDDVLFEREKVWTKMQQLNSESYVMNTNLDRNKLSSPTPDHFWAYIAGLMDSDGSFSINADGYSPVIQLSMIDVRGINYLNHNFPGGNIQVIHANTCKCGFTYRWSTKKLDVCKNFLFHIIPHLRVKRNSAGCLLEYLEGRVTTKYRQGGVSQDDMEYRRHYHAKIKCINKHGVYKPSLIDLEGQEQADRAQA